METGDWSPLKSLKGSGGGILGLDPRDGGRDGSSERPWQRPDAPFQARCGWNQFCYPFRLSGATGPTFSVRRRKGGVLRGAIGDPSCDPAVPPTAVLFLGGAAHKGARFPQTPVPAPHPFVPSSPARSCLSCAPCAIAPTCPSPGWPLGGDTQSRSAGSYPGVGQTHRKSPH